MIKRNSHSPRDVNVRYGFANNNENYRTSLLSDIRNNISNSSGCWSRVIQVASITFTLVAFILFILGLSRSSHVIMRVDGWDEVFAVVGAYCFFPTAIAAYHLAARMPIITRALETTLWVYTLEVLLFLTYIAQQCVFMAYIVRYAGKLCWLFAIPDVTVAGMILAFQRFPLARHWPMLYVLSQAGKLATFWMQVRKNFYTATQLGSDGLLGTLMLTIPVVQFPVLISRVRAGTSLTRAYTTNMAAVFAHVLHYMDVLELYFSGLEIEESITKSVKLLLLFFAVMGHVTCNIYYAALFLKDEATVLFLRRFEEPNQDSTDLIAPNEPTRDDELLHYFLWTFFFIDLPYAVMRLVIIIVNDKEVSVFLGKNLMMVVGVVMILMRGRKP